MTSSVLISGAGIAGPTLGWWLARAGFDVTLVERAGEARSSGSPVDVRGTALTVAREMGVLEEIRAARTRATSLRFVDRRGAIVGHVDLTAIPNGGRDDVEIPRGDLAAILRRACAGTVKIISGDQIVSLSQDAHGVDVALEHGGEHRFDLVIGADGLHSGVRRLAFGPDSDFVRHGGLYVATLPVDEVDAGDAVMMYCEPGRAVAIHPVRGRAMAAFIWHSAPVAELDHHDEAQHKHIVATAYAGAGWRVPELLAQCLATDDLYFDAVSLVNLPKWSNGRVGLMGDAATCISLFGDGSSTAMASGYTLATELAGNSVHHDVAFARFEAEYRQLVELRQNGLRRSASMLIPRTRMGLAFRNFATHAVPVATAISRLGSLAPRRHAA